MITSYDLFEQLPKQTKDNYNERVLEKSFTGKCLACFDKPVRMIFNNGWFSEEDNYCKAVTCSEECYQYLLLILC